MRIATGLDSCERYHLTLGAAALGASLLVGSASVTTAMALGVAIQGVNYRALRRAAQRLLAGELGGSRAWTAGYALRFVFVGACMGLGLAAGADAVGLVLGLSVIVPAVVLAAWHAPAVALPSLAVPPSDDASWERWNPWLAREREPAEEDEEG